jgi:hypothetical protein
VISASQQCLHFMPYILSSGINPVCIANVAVMCHVFFGEYAIAYFGLIEEE